MKVVAYRAGLGPARATRPQKAHKNFLRAPVTSCASKKKASPLSLVHVGLKKFGSTQPSTSPFHLWRLTSQCIIVWASYYFSITEKLSICAASALPLLLLTTAAGAESDNDGSKKNPWIDFVSVLKASNKQVLGSQMTTKALKQSNFLV